MKAWPIGLVVLCLGMAAEARAAAAFCPHCHCRASCKKVCRMECGTRTEATIEYSCENEDFCIPGRSRICSVQWVRDEHGHKHRKIVWQPTCGEVRTRRKLVKKEVKKEVPDYKWFIEEVCCNCGKPIRPAEAAGLKSASLPANSNQRQAADLAERSELMGLVLPADDADAGGSLVTDDMSSRRRGR